MTLKLNGSTDGSVSIDAPADTSPTGSDITLTLPTSAGSANQFVKNGGTAGELEYSSMVETSDGDIGIGTTTPAHSLTNANGTTFTTGTAPQYRLNGGAGDSNDNDRAIFGLATADSHFFSDAVSGDAVLRTTNAGNLLFGTGTNEHVRLDSSGRVGINTTSPGSYYANQLVVNTGSESQSGITIVSGSSNQGMFAFADGTSGTARYSGFLDYNHSNNSLAFGANGSEAMRITSAGYVQVQANGSGDVRFQFNGNGTRIHNTTSGGHMDFYTNNAVRNRFLYNGQGTVFSNQTRVYPNTDNAVDLGSSGQRYDDVFATNGTIQTSDSRLKQEVETSVLGIDFVKALRPVSYKWIEGKKVPIVDGVDENGDNIYRTDADGDWVYESRDGARKHWGFIAQEVKQAVDDAGVDFAGWTLADKDDPDSTQSLRYEEFIAPLTKALQEAITKIETLETQNTAQQAQIDDLLARVTALEAAA